eukprot:11408521-Alexandrium_andersonii.AAC.1
MVVLACPKCGMRRFWHFLRVVAWRPFGIASPAPHLDDHRAPSDPDWWRKRARDTSPEWMERGVGGDM